MRPRDPGRAVARLALCVAAAGAVAGCAGANAEPADASTGTVPPVVIAGGASVSAPAPAGSVHPSRPATVSARAADTVVVVPVSGGALPGEIVDAIRAGGGDLVDPAEWTARYGTTVLAELAGPDVRLAEATRRAERTGDAWNRVDEAAWLAVSRTALNDLLADLAAAARIDGPAERTARIDNGGECVTDRYPPDPAGAAWSVQGCAYPRYPQMIAVGITRTGPDADPPTAVDPTIGPLVELLDGELDYVEVRLGPPGPDTATLHLSAYVALPAGLDVTTATDAVLAGPLAGWQVLRGDDSVLLSGPTGATWTLSAGAAVFEWAGRW